MGHGRLIPVAGQVDDVFDRGVEIATIHENVKVLRRVLHIHPTVSVVSKLQRNDVTGDFCRRRSTSVGPGKWIVGHA